VPRRDKGKGPVDMTVYPVDDRWKPYRSGPPQATTFDLFGAKVEHRQWWDGKQLTDFVLTLQAERGDTEESIWEDVLRVDCCHREVHAHRLYLPDPNDVYRVITPIETPEDLWEGADLAEDLVYGEWQEHLRRWEGI